MLDEHPVLHWALRRIAEAGAGDSGSPVFGEPLGDARRLTEAEAELVRAFPEAPVPQERLLADLGALLDRKVANGRTPRFMNQLYSGVLEEALSGTLLGVATNNTLSTRELAPLATEVERAVISWLLALCPWDAARAGGSATPGGSFSNFLAIHLGRRRAVAAHGIAATPRLALLTSDQSHYSIPKGAELAGLDVENVLEVATDERGRMRPDALAESVADARRRGLLPFLVNATLGTTVAGVLDPVRAIAAVAQAEGLWLHVDGAWGGFGLLGSDRARYAAGLEAADSLTWDAHKNATAPITSSFLLVRDAQALEGLRPPRGGRYLFHDLDVPRGEQDLGLTSLYCGKPFLALGPWLAWKALGAEGLRRRADASAELARRFAAWIDRSAGYELAAQPETPVVCFRPRSRAGASAEDRRRLVERTRERVNESGRWMMNVCPHKDDWVLRAVFVNPLLEERHVDELAAHLESCLPVA